MIRKTKTRWPLYLIGIVAPLMILGPAAGGYEEITVTNGGTIRGTIKFEGKVLKLPALDVFKFKEFCAGVPNESLVVGVNRGLRYAVVTLEGISKGKAVERESVHELDNVKCRFVPHIQSASVGQFVVLKNTDPILHTAHAYFPTGQPQFNVGLYPGRVSRKPLVTPGVVKVLCEVHPWMSAYIVVTEHPYHAVTDIYGDFYIENIPPGAYTLKAWHETLGTQEKNIEVKAGATVKVDFQFASSPGGKK